MPETKLTSHMGGKKKKKKKKRRNILDCKLNNYNIKKKQ